MSAPAGKRGEQLIARLCEEAFAADFVYANPHYQDGRFIREVCDALILFESTAVVVQIKSADRTKHASYDAEKQQRWIEKQLMKAGKQLSGAIKNVRLGRLVEVQNQRRGTVRIDPNQIKSVYGVILIEGLELPPAGATPQDLILARAGDSLHLGFEQFVELCRELSTIGDLLDYLHWRIDRVRSIQFMGSDELDLLAFYKQRRDVIDEQQGTLDLIWVEGGLWSEYVRSEHRAMRDQLDVPSRLLDGIIDRLHESVLVEDPESVTEATFAPNGAARFAGYVEIATELARMRRVERRMVGQRILAKANLYRTGDRPRFFAILGQDRVPMLFMIDDVERRVRMRTLGNVVGAAQRRYSQSTMIGVAISSPIANGFSIDAMYSKAMPVAPDAVVESRMQALGHELFGTTSNLVENEFVGMKPSQRGPRTRRFKKRRGGSR